MSQSTLRIRIVEPARRLATYTFPRAIHKTGFWRVQAAAILLFAGVSCTPGPALAQGSRIESFFDNAGRFLERQGRAIGRELDQLSAPDPGARNATGRPTMPLRNPRRDAPLAGAAPSPPVKRPENPARPEHSQKEAQKPEYPPPAEKAASSDSGTRHVPPPERNPAREGEQKDAEKPEPSPHPSQMASGEWTREEIDGARDACARTLSGVIVSYELADPLREGICGAPAPIRLSAVNAGPRVEIRPAATVTCAMAAELARWMEKSVQPAAKEHLGEEIVSIRNVASYSCRNRYNTPGKRISEHALANALDIAAFETASGKMVTLLEHWNAKRGVDGDAAAGQAGHSAGEKAADAVRLPADTTAKASPAVAKRALVTADAAAQDSPPVPDRKPENIPAGVPAPESHFLRAVFGGACERFGTTLGPESNAAHRDHFHFDMKERSYGRYCE